MRSIGTPKGKRDLLRKALRRFAEGRSPFAGRRARDLLRAISPAGHTPKQ